MLLSLCEFQEISESQWGRCCNLIQGVQGSLNSGVGWLFSDNLDTISVLGCGRHLRNCFTRLSCISYHTPAIFPGPWKFPVMVAIPSKPSWIMAILSSPVELVLLSTVCLLEVFGGVFCQIRTLFCFYKIFYFSLSLQMLHSPSWSRSETRKQMKSIFFWTINTSPLPTLYSYFTWSNPGVQNSSDITIVVGEEKLFNWWSIIRNTPSQGQQLELV